MSFEFIRKNYPNTDLYFYREWLETSGSGGWASSSLSGANIRRYHGMLIINTPLERKVLLSKLDETILFQGMSYSLGNNFYRGGGTPSEIYRLEKFKKDIYPEWAYEFNDFKIRKAIMGLKSHNAILLRYEILEAPGVAQLNLNPLVAGRDYHSLSHENNEIQQEASLEGQKWHYQAYDSSTGFNIKSNTELGFVPNPRWFYHFNYAAEFERGQEYEEDLFSPGTLQIKIEPKNTYYFLLTGEDLSISSLQDYWIEEEERRRKIVENIAVNAFSTDLILAADQFIIHTSNHLDSIIAGYHWFLDWGRDTMISLPGLCLTTHRFEEAKRILETFAKYIFQGIIPNRFADAGGKPEYNTADASLWFFIACYRYYLATHDSDILTPYWIGTFTSIVNWHKKGTLYHIHADSDGLLFQGENGIQLTWMDAKVGDWVVTPRTGKAVEINALWYNAHEILAFFFRKIGRY